MAENKMGGGLVKKIVVVAIIGLAVVLVAAAVF